MKKFLAKLICLIMLVCVSTLGLVACSESSWKGSVTLTNSGAVIENGGSIAETENYLYFINGIEGTTASNKMGEPLKGALLVADKNDLSKTEVVVPKLMVASDYGSGVFIDGGYVYYATPSIEKNSEGQIANDELSFMRTKLDGSGKTDQFFTISSDSAIATEYRIVKDENGVVFIYYYEQESTAIICYNTSTKTSSEIIKTDATANGDSLNKHYFIKSQNMSDVVGYYTTTVYRDTYNAESASGANYTRDEALYNRVYVIKAGSTVGELVVDGNNDPDSKLDDIKYSITHINKNYVFFTQTNSGNGRSETYAISNNEAKVGANWTNQSKITKIVNSSYVSSASLIVSLSEAYVMGDTKIYKTTLIEKDETKKKPIALKEEINKLLFVDNGELYFYNAEGHIAKFALDNADEANDNKKVILVSEDTAATGWYDVELKEIAGKKYLFYCDNSLTGKSYIKYVDLSADVKEKDSDGDDKNDLFYLDTEKIHIFGQMTDADIAAVFDSKIEVQATYSPANGIGVNEQDDIAFKEEIDKLQAEYNSLSSAVQAKVSLTSKNTLFYIAKAFEILEQYEKLAGIEKVGSATEAEELGYKTVYNEIKGSIQSFKNSYYREGAEAFINNNVKANYDKAVELFEAED